MALYANVVTVVTIKNLRCICTSLHPHKRNFKKMIPSHLFPSKSSGFGCRNSTHWGNSFWNCGGIRLSWNSGRNRVSHSSNSRRTSLAPIIDPYGEAGGLGGRSLIKPFIFTVAVCATSFVGAAVWQYENIRSQMISAWSRKIGSFNNIFRRKSGIRYEINKWWYQLSEGQRCAWVIIALNTMVFLMWRHPALRPTMVKYFCSNPAAKAVCWPMLLSTFSHYSIWHMMANMYVFYSFSTSIVNIFGKEQFAAFYVSAGVVSSFASYIHKVLQKKPSLSLGASGAIMAVLAAVCVQYPKAQLAIIFLPMLTFSAGTALKTVIVLDSLGLLMGWKLFDHAAHLGGALFGIAYIKWGQDLIWRQREPFIHWWHAIRDKPEK